MAKNELRDVVPSDGGIFQDLANHVKLILRLMGDPRVNSMLKLLPIGSLLYLVIPDLVPGPADDALIIWLGSTLFVEFCPPDVVQEHMDKIKRVIPGQWRDIDDGDTIDSEFRDLD